MGINFKESGDAIVAEKDGNGNWVLYNQVDDSANDPLLKIDEDTDETTWMDPPSGGVSNPMTEDLDAGGYLINNLLGIKDKDGNTKITIDEDTVCIYTNGEEIINIDDT